MSSFRLVGPISFPVCSILRYVYGTLCVIQMKDKEGRFDSTKIFDASHVGEFGVVEPLACPSRMDGQSGVICAVCFLTKDSRADHTRFCHRDSGRMDGQNPVQEFFFAPRVLLFCVRCVLRVLSARHAIGRIRCLGARGAKNTHTHTPVGASFFPPRVDRPKFGDAPCQNAILNQNTRTLHAGAPFTRFVLRVCFVSRAWFRALRNCLIRGLGARGAKKQHARGSSCSARCSAKIR